jgi:hypothetical protein
MSRIVIVILIYHRHKLIDLNYFIHIKPRNWESKISVGGERHLLYRVP